MLTAVTYFNVDTPENERQNQVKCNEKTESATGSRHRATDCVPTFISDECNLA